MEDTTKVIIEIFCRNEDNPVVTKALDMIGDEVLGPLNGIMDLGAKIKLNKDVAMQHGSFLKATLDQPPSLLSFVAAIDIIIDEVSKTYHIDPGTLLYKIRLA